MPISVIQQSFLCFALAVAVVTDVRSHKVFNWLTYPSAAVALVLAANGGWPTLMVALQGFGAGLLLGLAYMVFFRMGAGDAKLLIVIGAFTSASFVLHAAMYGAILGAPMALFVMWRRGVFGYTLKNMGVNVLMKASGATDISIADNAKAGKLPYAVPIAAGVVIAALVRGF